MAAEATKLTTYKCCHAHMQVYAQPVFATLLVPKPAFQGQLLHAIASVFAYLFQAMTVVCTCCCAGVCPACVCHH
jgi:hypothetical protein